MRWKITAGAAIIVVLTLFLWATVAESTLLPFLVAIPFVVIARVAWARSSRTESDVREE